LRLREKKYLTTRAVKAGVSAELKATTLIRSFTRVTLTLRWMGLGFVVVMVR
jgi:hypothetical protein